MIPERITRIIGAVGLCLVVLTLTACTPSDSPIPRALLGQPKMQKISDVPHDEGLYKLQFVNEQEGWLAIGNNLWRTANGGRTWELVHSTDADKREINGFGFFNSQTGWMLKDDRLYRTEDGGSTWTPQSALPIGYPKGDLQAISFVKDGRIGWAAGGVYRSISREELLREGYPNSAVTTYPDGSNAVLEGTIFRTDDGGTTWHQQSIPAGEVYRLLHLYFSDAEHGMALGDTGAFYTEDGGKQWKAIKFKDECVDQKFMETFEGHPVDAYFVNPNVGWLSYTDGYMAKSTDGGKTWCDLRHSSDVSSNASYDRFFQKLYFINPTHGWGLAADGSLHETKDGGATWARVDASIRFEDMYFLNASDGWAIAKEGLFRIAS